MLFKYSLKYMRCKSNENFKMLITTIPYADFSIENVHNTYGNQKTKKNKFKITFWCWEEKMRNSKFFVFLIHMHTTNINTYVQRHIHTVDKHFSRRIFHYHFYIIVSNNIFFTLQILWFSFEFLPPYVSNA